MPLAQLWINTRPQSFQRSRWIWWGYVRRSREIYERVTQTLTGHCCTGECYARRVPSESPCCPCPSAGAPVNMSRLRILRECNRYASHCYTLTSAIPDLMDPSGSHAMLGETKPTGLRRLPRVLRSVHQARHPVPP